MDIGCSSGNLLYHLRQELPQIEMTGGDAFPEIIQHCKSNPALTGIDFEHMDLLDIQTSREFDIVVLSAVLQCFNEDEFDRAISGVPKLTKQKGCLLAFDWFHPFEQNLAITETSKNMPDGYSFYFRPYSRMRAALEGNHFENISFEPFLIPIDLPGPSNSTDITSYTIRSDQGDRLSFRGSLFQPWCHVMAQKVGEERPAAVDQ